MGRDLHLEVDFAATPGSVHEVRTYSWRSCKAMIDRSQHVRSNKHVGQSPVHKSTLDKSTLLVVRKVLNSSARNPVAKTEVYSYGLRANWG